MQQSNNPEKAMRYNGTLPLLKDILKKEGIRGLYTGITGTIIRDIPGNIAWFGVYEYIAKLFLKEGQTKKDLNIVQVFIAGAAAYI